VRGVPAKRRLVAASEMPWGRNPATGVAERAPFAVLVGARLLRRLEARPTGGAGKARAGGPAITTSPPSEA